MTDKKTDKVLEKRAANFLLEALVARTSFSEYIGRADREIREYLLENNHIKKSGDAYSLTLEGRGYAVRYAAESRESSAA